MTPRVQNTILVLLSSTFIGAGGCSFEPIGLAGDGPPNPDAGDCGWTQAPLFFDPCDPQLLNTVGPPENLDNTNNGGLYVYDTDTGELTDPDGNTSEPPSTVLTELIPPVRIWYPEGFAIQADVTLRPVGTIPLLVASYAAIEVGGTIDVSSRLTGGDPQDIGAGASAGALCGTREGGDGADGPGGAGGGGGAFQSVGGSGGNGYENSDTGGAGTAVSSPASPSGGCAGGSGGEGRGIGGGIGGSGGGALHLAAQDSITIAGRLLAGGAGGQGGFSQTSLGGGGGIRDNGGGGGGSGGYLGVEAPSIQLIVGGTLAANGGAGGAGSNSQSGSDGADGLADARQAQGGNGSGGGGDGGFGANDTQLGQDGRNGLGGGGGGGGVGYIIVRGAVMMPDGTPTLSPVLTQLE